MADSGQRKRLYRHRVTCSECGKELDSDYAESHCKKHPGKKVKYSALYLQRPKRLISRIKQFLNNKQMLLH